MAQTSDSQSDCLAAARRRIQMAYSPQLLKSAGRSLVDTLTDHLATVESSGGNVLNWAEPAQNIQAASSSLRDSGPEELTCESVVDEFNQLIRTTLSRGLNLHDPRYIGHQVPASVPVAGLFDAAGSVTNQVMAIYEMGPWATAVEDAVVGQLGELIGWPRGEFAGFITHGGSLANLTSLLTARNVLLDDAWEQGIPRSGKSPVLVSHPDAHYCIARAAGVLGIGARQVVKAPLDSGRRIDADQLAATLVELQAEKRPIVAVVACACATPIGAFDPLNEIAKVCQDLGVWLHVDAAHGGAACFSRRHRHLVSGIDQVDSLVWDAHKMLFVPALCAFVFYRNKQHRFEAFRQDAPYLFDPSAPGLAEYDSGMKTMECTKRAAAFGLWGVWSLFGRQLFEDMVDVTFDLGRHFYEKLSEAPDFVPLHVPECNIVAFRYLPDELREAPLSQLGQFQLDLRRELIQSGEFYIVPTTFGGAGALRVTIINPLTTADHLDRLMVALRQHGKRLLEK